MTTGKNAPSPDRDQLLDRAWAERLCANARREGRPPALNQADTLRLERWMPVGKALELMGIPYFKRRGDRKAMPEWWGRPEDPAEEERG